MEMSLFLAFNAPDPTRDLLPCRGGVCLANEVVNDSIHHRIAVHQRIRVVE